MSPGCAAKEWDVPPMAMGNRYAYGGNMAVARSIVERVGGFDENILTGGSELDFALRASRDADADVAAVPAALVHYRIPTSAWGRLKWQFQKERGRRYLLRKHDSTVLGPSLGDWAISWARLLVLAIRGVVGVPARQDAADLAGRLLGSAFWALVPRSLLVRRAAG
jgi:GT2 family glycosyltransferase